MILITGGNGLVGTRLALKLQGKVGQVRVLALASSESDAILREAGVEIRYGDVTRSDDIQSAMSGVYTVYHLAAILSSPEKPSRFHSVNTGGTLETLAAAGRSGATHFIFVSSISVTYPRRNAYSASKAEAEELVRQSGIPWTIVRPCLVLEGLEFQTFAAAVLRWPVVPLPHRGAARKRPISAEDLAGGLAGLAQNTGAFHKTIALGGSEIVSLREMAESILRTHGLRKRVWPVPEGLLRVAAAWTEVVSRMLGRKLSWVSQQSVDGLVYDATPDLDPE